MSGIWTKHLKAKTELHQTVIDRTLKSLLQKNLIKVVKSVKVYHPFLILLKKRLHAQLQHPTRKIYMLANLTPSVEMTGGPWFTDNELDTEFIKLLLEACAHYIRERVSPTPFMGTFWALTFPSFK
jgi:DNA-directed RNA polymerase III subunit RPC6